MDSVKGQLTLRGIVIGCVGCAIITAASVYTALKMGALPWPIVFAAIISLCFLKALGHGKASLNEANVTHTVMSAGAMVAGGLAFTIPGIWMLGYADEVGWFEMLLVAVSGVIMGLVCTALLRRHFIEDSELEYPIGEAAAQTLIAGDSGGKTVINRLFQRKIIYIAVYYSCHKCVSGARCVNHIFNRFQLSFYAPSVSVHI